MPRNHRNRKNRKRQKNKRRQLGKQRNGNNSKEHQHGNQDQKQSPKKQVISRNDVSGPEGADAVAVNDGNHGNDGIAGKDKIQRHESQDSKEVTSPTIKSTSHSNIHSPLAIHYEADDDDHSDTHHLSPLHQPSITPGFTPDPHDQPSLSSGHSNQGESPTPTRDIKKIQILRSAKISQRNTRFTDSSDDAHSHHNSPGIFSSAFGALNRLARSYSDPNTANSARTPSLSHDQSTKSIISPGFTDNSPKLLAHHSMPHLPPISPLPGFRRASSDGALTPVRGPVSPVRSPGRSILYGSPSRSSSPSHSHSHSGSHSGPHSAHHIRFGAVEVHEFKLTAGSESDGVPEDGGYSLTLDREEVYNQTVDLEEYERQRYSRWTKRAKDLHWPKHRMSQVEEEPERYLFTAGRSDEFFDYLSAKERKRRLESVYGKEWRKEHFNDLSVEFEELTSIRKSRESDVFCDCKPLSKMGTNQLKEIAERHGIKIKSKKLKKGFLVNMIKSKVLNHRDVCCWDKESCACCKRGIECHSGLNDWKCGCVKFNKKCDNPEGRYMYKNPEYGGEVIKRWRKYYEFDEEEEENADGYRDSKVSFGTTT